MNQFIGKGKIGYGIGILTTVIVVIIRSERLTKTMIVIKHRGHPVKAESVKTELLKPVFAIG